MSLKHRVNKLEQSKGSLDNPVTEIRVNYVGMDGTISSSTVKKLIDGVWCDGNLLYESGEEFYNEQDESTALITRHFV